MAGCDILGGWKGMGLGMRKNQVHEGERVVSRTRPYKVTKPQNAWPSELGRRIQARRESLGISRGALAKRCGVYALFLKDIEEGLEVPELITLYRIGNVLNVTPAELLEGLGP